MTGPEPFSDDHKAIRLWLLQGRAMFMTKAQRAQRAIGVTLADDLEALEDTLRSILQVVEPKDAWQLFQPHAERVVERAGGLGPIAEEEIERMLGTHGVTRWVNPSG